MDAQKLSFSSPGLPSLLEELLVWLNNNLPVDPRKPLTLQDIAHVSLMTHEFAQLPGETVWCAYRRVAYRRAGGVEFWAQQLQLPELHHCADLRGRIVWEMTSNTAALFRRRPQPCGVSEARTQ